MEKGQALIEYLLLFGMISLVSMGLARAISTFMGNTTGSLSYSLTQQLTTGSCPRFCFFGNYGNGDE
jgi:Flp pilus assembly pilin Flp